MSDEISSQEFEDLKEEVRSANSAADKAKGALATIKTTLQEDFGVKTLKEANEALAKLESMARVSKEQYDKAHAKYVKEWHGDED